MGQPDRPVLACSILLVGCLTLGVGCSTTGGSRFRTAAGSRSTATVGDQAVPPTVGAIGDRVTPDAPEPEPYRNPKARISGRVVDPQGRAIAGASVRLADGSSPVGRDARTTTDASGAFTLGGLRPGSGYLLIAEANFGDERGTLIGRAQADTAETRVQIRLGGAEEAATDDPAAVVARPRSRPVQSISDRTQRPSQVNDEDLSPPADPDEPDQSARPGQRRSRPDRSAGSSGWHKPGESPANPGQRPDESVSPVEAHRDIADAEDGIDSGTTPGRGGDSRGDEAEEVDPLPPSLPAPTAAGTDRPGRGPRSRRQPAPVARVVDDPPPAEPEGPPPGEMSLGRHEAPPGDATAGGTGLMPMPSFGGPDALAQPAPAAEVASLAEPPPLDAPTPVAFAAAPAPAPMVPGVVVSAATEPASVPVLPPVAPPPAATGANYDPFALVAAAPARPDRPATSPPPGPGPPGGSDDSSLPNIPPRPTAPSAAPETATTSPDGAGRSRRWGDLAAAPAAAATATATATAGDSARRVAAGPGAARPAGRPGVLLARRSRPAEAAVVDAPAESKFDSRSNQLIDFQLPGLDGQAVRFRDLDADFVVLDFWGTWCKECINFIPQLIELQKKYGPDQLRVVGIACEKTPPGKRNAQVAAVADRLGINYSVLVASLEADPVQRDFQVRFYPTMILLDRRGNVLFKGEGGTESNLFRLEKALSAARKASSSDHH